MKSKRSPDGVITRLLARRCVPILTWFAVFVVEFAFSFQSTQPRMAVFANVILAGVAASVAFLSYHKYAIALSGMAVLCIGAPVLGTNFAAVELVVVFVMVQVAWRSELRASLIASVGFVSLSINDLWQRKIESLPYSGPTVLYPIILTALAVGFGHEGRLARRQNAKLIALQHVERDRAISVERQRIARDLHDVAAHHLSALVVQNKLARRIATVEALDEAADFSARTASEALDALRQIVGVLGDSQDSPLAPQPTLSDIELISQRLFAVGLQIHSDVDSTLLAAECDATMTLPRDVELAVVRVAQEALTNVLRHSGSAEAWLSLTVNQDELQLSVEDSGGLVHHKSPSNVVDAPANGYGLINMRERTESLRGSFRIDTSPRGGWRVLARFPLGDASKTSKLWTQ